MTSDLIERLKDALENSCDSPWLPGLTKDLAEVGWRKLYRDIGLSPSNYGTARVMARAADAPRRIVARIPIALSAGGAGLVTHVETLNEDFARSYEEAGIRFYTTEEIRGTNVLGQLEAAVSFLKLVPSLYEVAANLVKSIHLIDAGDDDYDVSFSEPNIPFTIFVSVPYLHSPIGALRVTEALVHEAMHLQLTLLERVVTLTELGGWYFSPWRKEYRNAQGVLHSLYVFRSIDRFFEDMIANDCALGPEGTKHISSRRIEIYEQIRDIKSFKYCTELTRIGVDFVRQLLQPY